MKYEGSFNQPVNPILIPNIITCFDVILATGSLIKEVVAVVIFEELLGVLESEAAFSDGVDVDKGAGSVCRSVLTISANAQNHHVETEKSLNTGRLMIRV